MHDLDASAGDRALTHLVIVGLMGSGKTTVGRVLAERLGWPLRDSDPEIEGATGRTVKELRDEIGVGPMHDLEAGQLLEALDAPGPSVICPGASVIDVDACRDALRRPGVAVVFLAVSPGVAAARFGRGEHRPWYGSDPKTFLARQAVTRYPRFRSVDPIELAADDASPGALAESALDAMAARGIEVPPRA